MLVLRVVLEQVLETRAVWLWAVVSAVSTVALLAVLQGTVRVLLKALD